jgi:hypothetical protein
MAMYWLKRKETYKLPKVLYKNFENAEYAWEFEHYIYCPSIRTLALAHNGGDEMRMLWRVIDALRYEDDTKPNTVLINALFNSVLDNTYVLCATDQSCILKGYSSNVAFNPKRIRNFMQANIPKQDFFCARRPFDGILGGYPIKCGYVDSHNDLASIGDNFRLDEVSFKNSLSNWRTGKLINSDHLTYINELVGYLLSFKDRQYKNQEEVRLIFFGCNVITTRYGRCIYEVPKASYIHIPW